MFTQEVADRICERLASGMSLRAVCRAKGMPHVVTVLRWLDAEEAFRSQYARACLARADARFEELDEVSEAAAKARSGVKVQGLRLKADNMKWQLARMNPKKYGERVVHAGDAENPLAIKVTFG